MNRIVYHVNQDITEYYAYSDKHGYVQVMRHEADDWHAYDFVELRHDMEMIDGKYGMSIRDNNV